MSLTIEDRQKALENEYFHRKENELIAKMKERIAGENSTPTAHVCPSGDGGELVETMMDAVKIEVCNKCHGVWLDAGELAQIIDSEKAKNSGSWLINLIS